jgi:hypothetical protein
MNSEGLSCGRLLQCTDVREVQQDVRTHQKMIVVCNRSQCIEQMIVSLVKLADLEIELS